MRKPELRLSIFKRLILSNFLVILLVGISSLYTLMSLDALNRVIESIIRYDSRMIKLAEDALDDLYNLMAAEDKYRISGDPDYDRQFKLIRSDFAKKLQELGAIADTKVKADLLTDIERAQGRYVSLLHKQKARESNDRTYFKSREEIARDMDRNLRHLIRVSTGDRNSKLQQSNDRSARVTQFSVLLGVLAFSLAVLITFINARKINSPIKLLGEKTQEVADGQCGVPLQIASPPEIKALADAFNVMCDRLKEMDQAKIDYVNHLSHELRTPLAVIKEASSMLQEGVFSQAPEKQEELFRVIKEDCDRLISSVNRILDFSRMEAGGMSFSFQQTNLRSLMEKAVRKLSPLAGSKKIELHLDLPEKMPDLRMDPERIEEVLENLLGNALKYTPAGGQITVFAVFNSENGTVEVSVGDNGRGIPEEGLLQVFEKFKRVDERRGAVMGTGLGLSIVRHILNAHGGKIWVKSKVGEGSTFTFSLPVSP